MHIGSTQSAPNDQASNLRRLMAKDRRNSRSIAIVSGKGGVGKSSIAVNLSIYLTQRGVSAALADLDFGLANADLLMNVKPIYTLSHVVEGQRTLEEIMLAGPGGVRFLPGGSGTGSVANLSEFDRHLLIVQLGKLLRNTDIVVFDCGAGIARNVISIAQTTDDVVVVTTPEPTAMTDAYAMIKSLRREPGTGHVSLFVNMANSRAEAIATFERVAGVAKRFLDYSVANSGYMLHDIVVEQAVRQRCPFVIGHPASNASACIAAMASELLRTCKGAEHRGGLLKRVAGLFI